MNKKYRKNTFFALTFIFVVAAFGKFYQYNFSDASGFGIMGYILNAINNDVWVGMPSYDFPARVYSLFKFLGFKTNLEWSIFFTIIFSIIMFILLLRFDRYTLKEYIYIFFSMFVLSWTVFNANKDLIQLIFLLIIYGIFHFKTSNKTKIICSSIIFILEAIFFRNYYILEAGLLIITFYFLAKNLNKENTNMKILKTIVFIFISFFLGVYCCKFISSSSFYDLINRRESLEGAEQFTVTIIQNVFVGNNILYFIPNYIINFIRICFPIEIVRFGFKYCLFFVYQVYNMYILCKAAKGLNKKNIIYVSLILSYLIMLVASESDFGTLARHQSVLLMFYIELMKCKEGDQNEK